MDLINIVTIDSEADSVARLGWPIILSLSSFKEDFKEDVVYVRWGNSMPMKNLMGNIEDFSRVINPFKTIQLNCSKNKALKVMSKVVHTTHIYNPYDTVPKNKLAVIRPECHSSGHEFLVVKGPYCIKRFYYGTAFIPSNIEYRVWFAGDKTCAALRVPTKTQTVDKYPCRSQWGYKFLQSVPKTLHKDTLAAAKAIGLEVGAADVLKYRNNFYFLELNSAPTIDHKKLIEFYQKGLVDLIKNKFGGYYISKL